MLLSGRCQPLNAPLDLRAAWVVGWWRVGARVGSWRARAGARPRTRAHTPVPGPRTCSSTTSAMSAPPVPTRRPSDLAASSMVCCSVTGWNTKMSMSTLTRSDRRAADSPNTLVSASSSMATTPARRSAGSGLGHAHRGDQGYSVGSTKGGGGGPARPPPTPPSHPTLPPAVSGALSPLDQRAHALVQLHHKSREPLPLVVAALQVHERGQRALLAPLRRACTCARAGSALRRRPAAATPARHHRAAQVSQAHPSAQQPAAQPAPVRWGSTPPTPLPGLHNSPSSLLSVSGGRGRPVGPA